MSARFFEPGDFIFKWHRNINNAVPHVLASVFLKKLEISTTFRTLFQHVINREITIFMKPNVTSIVSEASFENQI